MIKDMELQHNFYRQIWDVMFLFYSKYYTVVFKILHCMYLFVVNVQVLYIFLNVSHQTLKNLKFESQFTWSRKVG